MIFYVDNRKRLADLVIISEKIVSEAIDMKRIKRKEPEEEKGTMGIGTLIIFISIVLVASVAASVFINTVKMLQQQAQKTAEQAMQQVSTSFQVRSCYGYTNDNRTNIDEIYLNLGLGAGSPTQNLNYTLIHIDDGTMDTGLNYSSGSTTSTRYNATELLDPEGYFTKENPLISAGTTVKLKIDADAIGLDLSTQTECRIEITPKHGTSSIEIFNTPPVFDRSIIHFS